MERKKFLLTATLSAFGLSTFASVVPQPGGAFKSDCETGNDILGPFYRPGAPKRSDLTYQGLEGVRIDVKGTVYGSDCVTPLSDALVEIWHCDTEGEYDNESAKYRQRASWTTGSDGKYAFKTILPGKYLNGKLYRPAHIHFRVSEGKSKELISQLYFKGDPHIETDPWASRKTAAHRIIGVVPEDIHGNLAVNFDIYMQSL